MTGHLNFSGGGYPSRNYRIRTNPRILGTEAPFKIILASQILGGSVGGPAAESLCVVERSETARGDTITSQK